MPGGAVTEADPYGDEALTFVKEMIMQREVEIEVESIGKYSTFTLVFLKITLVIDPDQANTTGERWEGG